MTLGTMLALGRDLARTVGVERMARLTRIEGGLALQAPGMAIALLGDRVLVIHWTRAPEALRMAQDWLTRRLGAEFPIEDMQTVAAGRTAGRAAKPQDREADRVLPDPVEPDPTREPAGEDPMQTAATEDDLDPGL